MHSARALEFWLRNLVAVNRTVSKSFASEDELDRAAETLFTSTMGTVVAALRSLVDDPDLEVTLTRAVAERNRLAHQFFGEWAEVWSGPETDARMIQDAHRVRSLSTIRFAGSPQSSVRTWTPSDRIPTTSFQGWNSASRKFRRQDRCHPRTARAKRGRRNVRFCEPRNLRFRAHHHGIEVRQAFCRQRP